MKKTFIAATAGILAGVTLLLCATPAMAQPRIGFGLSIGLPVPAVYIAPPPVAYVEPAPVVYGGYGYGPVVRVDAPYYYRDWRYYHGYHGYHGDHDDRGYRGDHEHHDHDDHHGWHR
jgi:hypothetical protein